MRTLPALFMLTALLMAGVTVQESDAPPARGVNEVCPVMEGEPVGEKPVVIEYQGKLINLCCKKCKRLFFEEPAKYLAGLPQFATAAPAAAAGASVSVAPTVPAAVDAVAKPAPALRDEDQIPLFEWAGRFHVVVVHFPVALSIFACWLEWLALIRRRARPHAAALPLLAGALVSAMAAIVLGEQREESLEFTGARHTVLENHELWAWITLGALVAALICLRWAGNSSFWRKLYLVAVTAAAIAVGIAGHAGGRLTQGLGFFSRV